MSFNRIVIISKIIISFIVSDGEKGNVTIYLVSHTPHIHQNLHRVQKINNTKVPDAMKYRYDDSFLSV